MARFDFHVQCNHLLARISAFLTSSLTSLSPVVVAFKAPCYLRFYSIGRFCGDITTAYAKKNRFAFLLTLHYKFLCGVR